MEVALKRTLVVSVALLVFGLVAQFQPKSAAPARTEKWMEDHIPTQIGNFSMIPSADNPRISYKMSESTYKELNPYGIVARIFLHGERRFDTVVVAANDRISLHEPTVCFPGQDWRILSETMLTLDTKKRDKVKVMLLALDSSAGKRYALYTFRGPSGTFPIRDHMFFDWFKAELRGIRPEGALMRVMTCDPYTDAASLQEFATQWFDETYVTSGKVF